MTVYLVVKESLFHPYVGRYISYGIKAVDMTENIQIDVVFISDVSMYLEIVLDIAQRCTLFQLDPIHLMDISFRFRYRSPIYAAVNTALHTARTINATVISGLMCLSSFQN